MKKPHIANTSLPTIYYHTACQSRLCITMSLYIYIIDVSQVNGQSTLSCNACMQVTVFFFPCLCLLLGKRWSSCKAHNNNTLPQQHSAASPLKQTPIKYPTHTMLCWAFAYREIHIHMHTIMHQACSSALEPRLVPELVAHGSMGSKEKCLAECNSVRYTYT